MKKIIIKFDNIYDNILGEEYAAVVSTKSFDLTKGTFISIGKHGKWEQKELEG